MRFVYSINAAGTKSYRTSSRKLFGTMGGNAQNVPETVRKYLVADPGYEIGQVDQGGAEALIVAYLCEPGIYRELFQYGIKPHTYLALNIFTDKFRGQHSRDRYQFQRPGELVQLPEWKALNKSISKDASNETEYALGKMTAHAKAYDMKAPTFRLNVLQKSSGRICLTLAEAKHFLDTYDRLFPEVLSWQAETEQTVQSTRRLYNLFGYPREFTGRLTNDLLREALSFVPQSTVGCLTSIAVTELQQALEQHNWQCDILANVHDAIVTQHAPEIRQPVLSTIQKSFGRPLTTPRGETFHMKSSAMYGPTWAKEDMIEMAE
jgi:hypothetical protein